jgi:DNA-binding LacI/PurR family transcriptional regulator
MSPREGRVPPPGDGRSVTMKDVAAAAGVSQSTVSRILNDASLSIPISEKTRARVHAVANDLGYSPHPFARALRGAPTMLLGAVVRDITDLFFLSAIEALCLEAKTHGYSVVLGHAAAAADEALALAAVLEARQCDALVLLGDLRDEPLLVADIQNVRIPVVAVWHGSQMPEHRFPMVDVDNRFGIRAALDHLKSLGHRRIAFVGGDTLQDIRERKAAYQEYMAEQDTDMANLPDAYIQPIPNTTTAGKDALDGLLALPQPPTAIIAATDVMAIGVIHAAYERDINVPGDLSVVGFDDIPLASVSVPGLTTVRMPTTRMIATAVDIVIGADAPLAGMPNSRSVIFEPTLIIRRSTAPPKDADRPVT